MATNPELIDETPQPAVEDVQAPAEEAAVAETGDTADEGETDGQPRDERGKFVKDGVQKRIDELTRARREAEREAEYWRGVATQTAQVDAAERPTRDDFADDDAYTEALAAWSAQQAVVKTQRQQATAAAENARMAAWAAREAEVKATIPDYDQVVPTSQVPVQQHVLEALLDSEQGPALAYHLAKNPDVAERLNGLSPVRAAIELGRLEATLTAPVVKQPSNAPPPPTPITSAPSLARDPAKMNTAEYIAWRKSQPVRW